jgi:hypothetical protein
VKIAAANRGRGNAHDRIGGFDEFRILDLFDCDFAGLVKNDCSHPRLLITGA